MLEKGLSGLMRRRYKLAKLMGSFFFWNQSYLLRNITRGWGIILTLQIPNILKMYIALKAHLTCKANGQWAQFWTCQPSSYLKLMGAAKISEKSGSKSLIEAFDWTMQASSSSNARQKQPENPVEGHKPKLRESLTNELLLGIKKSRFN